MGSRQERPGWPISPAEPPLSRADTTIDANRRMSTSATDAWYTGLMARLRWGTEPPSTLDSARTRLIDAAEECFRRYGVSKTTVEDVAKAAQVSRATVYRYFDGRDSLVLGVLEREGGRFMQRLFKRLGRSPNLSVAIIDGVLYTVKAVKADEHLALLFAPEAAGLTVSIPGATDAMYKLAISFLRPLIQSAEESGQLRPGVEVDEAAEWILRATLSLLTTSFPVSRPPAAERRFLETFLVRAVVDDGSSGGRSARMGRKSGHRSVPSAAGTKY